MANKFIRVPADVSVSQLTPLEIECGSTKCEEGFHCFRTSQRDAKKFGKHGVCKVCGINLIDWKRIHKNRIRDAKFIFDSMKNELIRHVFWHTKIDESAIKNALQFNKEDMREHAKKVLKRSIGKAATAWDGQQTKKTGNEIINYAQHATATCCRRCLEYWHGIKKDKNLTEEDLEFCADLTLLYIQERVPNLPYKITLKSGSYGKH